MARSRTPYEVRIPAVAGVVIEVSSETGVMGTTVIGGMLAATLIAIFLIPVMFYVIESFAKRGKDGG